MTAGVVGPRGRITRIDNTTYTLRDSDNRNTLCFNNAGAITVTIPLSLQIGWTIDIIQQGAGAISFTTASGVTLNNLNGATGVSGQWALARLTAIAQNVFDLAVLTAATIPTVRTVAGTTDTILITDHGNAVRYTNAGAIAVTVPAGLGAGFNCLLLQIGAGVFTVAGSGVTVENRQSQLSSAGANAQCSLFADTTTHLIFGGDTA